MVTLLALGVALSVCAPLPQPQEGEPGLARERGFGMVRTAAGEPWPGAEVHLLHRPHRDVLDESVADRIVTSSDERGRFRVELLPGARYVAWARAPQPDDDGRVRITRLATDATASTPILLDEGEGMWPRRVRLAPHASWDGHDLRVLATSYRRGANLAEWLQSDEDGLFTLPIWPGSGGSLQLYSDGWLVHRAYTGLTESWARRELGDMPDADPKALLRSTWELAVPPRRTRRMEFKTDAKGSPVSGAEAFPDQRPPGLEAPVSGADGVFEVVFASEEENPQRLPFSYLVVAEGCAEGTMASSSWTSGAPPETERQLPAGRGVEGRLTLAGKPLADVPLVLEGSVGTSDSGSWFGVDGRVFHSRADGTFTIPGRCDRFRYRLTAVLTPEQRAHLAAALDARRDSDDERPPGPVSACVVLASADDPPTDDLGDLEFTHLEQVDVTVEAADGTPPGPTAVSWIRCLNDHDAPHDTVRLSTDRHGRLRIVARRRAGALLMAQDATGIALRILEADDRYVTLRLDPRHRVKVRIVDGADRPIPGARAHIVSVERFDAENQALGTTLRNMASVHAWSFKTGTADDDGIAFVHTPLLDTELDFAIYLPGEQRNSPRKNVYVPAKRDPDEPVVIHVPEAGGR